MKQRSAKKVQKWKERFEREIKEFVEEKYKIFKGEL